MGEKKVLLCSTTGSHNLVMLHDTILYKAFEHKNAKPEILLCNGCLPACEAFSIYSIGIDELFNNEKKLNACKACWEAGYNFLTKYNIKINKYSDYYKKDDILEAENIISKLKDNELKDFVYKGVKVGEDAYAGTLRYFALGDIQDEENGIKILKLYLKSAIVSVNIIERVFDDIKPHVAVFHHGIYVPLGIIGKIARKNNIRVVNWSLGYRKKTFIYSHNDTYHLTMIEEDQNDWKSIILTKKKIITLDNYLKSRINSKNDWVKFNEEPLDKINKIKNEIGLNNRPIILLLTNVTWDAQLFYKNNAFPSLLDWLEYSIRYFDKRKDLQLVIRVHPAEIRGTMKTRQPVIKEMKKRINVFPDNVFIVDSESNISTYTLADISDSVIIFGTKTGVELTVKGIPVIVAGEAWIRNKGLTIDISSKEQYEKTLNSLPLNTRMSEDKIELSKKYAYHYFFRRLIPIKCMSYKEKDHFIVIKRKIYKFFNKSYKNKSHYFSIRKDFLKLIKKNKDKGIDLISDCILENKKFIFDI